MQAIQTKYHGPSNTRGSYVTAKCSAGSLRFGWDDALNSDDNHRAAARALIVKLHWHRTHDGGDRPVWYTGGLDDGSMVHVCAEHHAKIDARQEPARPYVSPLKFDAEGNVSIVGKRR